MARLVDAVSEQIVEETPTERVEGPILPTRKRVTHLPIIGRHYWARALGAGTVDIRLPASGDKLRLTYVHIAAKAAAYVFLQFSNHTGLPDRIAPSYMSTNSVMNANLVGTNIEGESDEKLQFVTDAGTVEVMVVVEEVPAGIVAEEETA